MRLLGNAICIILIIQSYIIICDSFIFRNKVSWNLLQFQRTFVWIFKGKRTTKLHCRSRCRKFCRTRHPNILCMKQKSWRKKEEKNRYKMCSVYGWLTLACWSKPTSQMINKVVLSKQTIAECVVENKTIHEWEAHKFSVCAHSHLFADVFTPSLCQFGYMKNYHGAKSPLNIHNMYVLWWTCTQMKIKK